MVSLIYLFFCHPYSDLSQIAFENKLVDNVDDLVCNKISKNLPTKYFPQHLKISQNCIPWCSELMPQCDKKKRKKNCRPFWEWF